MQAETKNNQLTDLLCPEKYFNFSVNTHVNLTGKQLQQYYQQFQCCLCYQISLKPVRCKKCRHVYCLVCVANQKKVDNTCAFRCKSDFSIQKCEDFLPTFHCPYKQKCLKQLKSSIQFLKHYSECQFYTKHQRDLLYNRQHYRCKLGLHKLQFYTGTYQEMINQSICCLCNQKNVCRTQCRQCNQKFCLKCRPLPLSKYTCPIGHKLQSRNIANIYYICDFCSLPSSIVGRQIYDDPLCNFGICSLCYSQLPEKCNEVQLIANQPQFCQKSNPKDKDRQQHRLEIIKQKIKKVCKFCNLQKICHQKCRKCQELYCLSCKPFLLQSLHYCQYNHKIIKKIFKGQQNQRCNQCDHNNQALQGKKVFYDQKCNIFLCQKCFSHGLNIQLQRHRFWGTVQCPKNHIMTFHSGIKQFQNYCGKCQKIMPIKFFCNTCNQNKLFCSRCCLNQRQTGKCYFDHRMLKFEGNDYKELLQIYSQQNGYDKIICHECGNFVLNQVLYRCDLCNYHVCVECQTGLKNNGSSSQRQINQSSEEQMQYYDLNI